MKLKKSLDFWLVDSKIVVLCNPRFHRREWVPRHYHHSMSLSSQRDDKAPASNYVERPDFAWNAIYRKLCLYITRQSYPDVWPSFYYVFHGISVTEDIKIPFLCRIIIKRLPSGLLDSDYNELISNFDFDDKCLFKNPRFLRRAGENKLWWLWNTYLDKNLDDEDGDDETKDVAVKKRGLSAALLSAKRLNRDNRRVLGSEFLGKRGLEFPWKSNRRLGSEFLGKIFYLHQRVVWSSSRDLKYSLLFFIQLLGVLF